MQRSLVAAGEEMRARAEAHNWLEVDSASSRAGVLAMVERRFPAAILEQLEELGLAREEIEAIVLPGRLGPAGKTLLSLDESDRLVRLLRVLSLAERVYGSRVCGLSWLRRANPRLLETDADAGRRTPISLLTTNVGAGMVEELLTQIDEGYFI